VVVLFLGDGIMGRLGSPRETTRNIDHVEVVQALGDYIAGMVLRTEGDAVLTARLSEALGQFAESIREGRDATQDDIHDIGPILFGIEDEARRKAQQVEHEALKAAR
jgi:hypothetical protein